MNLKTIFTTAALIGVLANTTALAQTSISKRLSDKTPVAEAVETNDNSETLEDILSSVFPEEHLTTYVQNTSTEKLEENLEIILRDESLAEQFGYLQSILTLETKDELKIEDAAFRISRKQTAAPIVISQLSHSDPDDISMPGYPTFPEGTVTYFNPRGNGDIAIVPVDMHSNSDGSTSYNKTLDEYAVVLRDGEERWTQQIDRENLNAFVAMPIEAWRARNLFNRPQVINAQITEAVHLGDDNKAKLFGIAQLIDDGLPIELDMHGNNCFFESADLPDGKSATVDEMRTTAQKAQAFLNGVTACVKDPKKPASIDISLTDGTLRQHFTIYATKNDVSNAELAHAERSELEPRYGVSMISEGYKRPFDAPAPVVEAVDIQRRLKP